MTGDPRFRGRVRRLAVTSGVALGVTWTMAGTLDAPPWIDILLLAGWISMFTVLTLSLARPSIRRLVVVPSVMVTAALIGICLWELRRPAWRERGGSPHCRDLDGRRDGRLVLVPMGPGPSSARSGLDLRTLIAAHVGLVVGGTVLILVGQVV